MALNFPADPAVGDVFGSATRTWRWDGTTWAVYNQTHAVGGLTGVDFVQSPEFIDFDTSLTPATAAGRISWNQSDGTFNAGLSGGVTLQLGQEALFPPVKNDSGAQIPAGSLVMATGAQGDKVTVAKAVSDGSVDAQYLIGIATEDIAIGATDGKVTTFGYVRDVNTSSWSIGTLLYPNPSAAGGLTSTQSAAPALRMPVAMVVRQHATTGRIIVRMSNGSALGETDDNVKFASLASNDIVSWDAAQSLWVNRTQASLFSSPALTGSPTAPTPANGDNSTLIATTAFVASNASPATIDGGTPSGTSGQTFDGGTP